MISFWGLHSTQFGFAESSRQKRCFCSECFPLLGESPKKASITFYDYPLENVYIAKWKDPPSLSSVNQRTKWAIFNSYVQLPEGI